MTKLSKNFTLNELCKSDTAIKNKIENKPDELAELRLKVLATKLLQPLRDEFGRMKVNSGYRNTEVNKLVGGVPTSLHTKSIAADCTFLDADINDVWNFLLNNKDRIKWTEIGLYKSRNFIHLAYDQHDLKMKVFTK